jgi:adenylate kinase family enzyme
LVVRDDDREEVIRERLEEYERQTRPVLEHFSGSGHAFYTVDASDDPPGAIVHRICGLVRASR